MCFVRAAICAALFHIFCATALFAQDVTLTSRDGAVEIDGTLIGYDGEFYRVDSAFGILTLDGSGVVCSGPGCPELGAYVAELRITGERSIGATLIPRLIEQFAEENELTLRRIVTDDFNFRYDMSSGETGQMVARFSFALSTTVDGFDALIAGNSDLILAAHEAPDDIAKAAQDAGVGNLSDPARSRIVALDGLVAVAAPDNPVTSISIPDLIAVMNGATRNWTDLGGLDAPVILHALAPTNGTGAAVRNRLMDSEIGEGAILHDTASSLVDAIARDPFAIGVTRYSEVGSAKVLGLSGACGFDFYASTLALRTEDYPLTTPLFVYTPARRLPKLAREFLRYLGSNAAQRVVRRVGFVDQTVEEIALSAQGQRLANAIALAGEETSLIDLQRLVTALRGGSRLSLTFRFQTGSTELDAQSRSNIRQLAQLLEAGVFDGKTLRFVGFSDGEGAAEGNRRIALRRANAVRASVREAAETLRRDLVSLEVDGFGEAMPMACDDSDWGRQVNRRVELWVQPGNGN